MPWNKRNYPASMKNLPSVVRNKAIEIANALLKDGYEEGRAIAIAQDQAREWARNHGEAGHHERVHVEPHDRGWAVRSEDAQRAMKVYERKQEASPLRNSARVAWWSTNPMGRSKRSTTTARQSSSVRRRFVELGKSQKHNRTCEGEKEVDDKLSSKAIGSSFRARFRSVGAV